MSAGEAKLWMEYAEARLRGDWKEMVVALAKLNIYRHLRQRLDMKLTGVSS